MTTLPPLTVIGGYLGAGKTTLLNAILTQATGLRAAVLVNDFGDINIDAALVREHDGETMSLVNGCICCSIAGSLGVALGQVLRRAGAIDAVVIEASGVGEPGRIAEFGAAYRLPLDGVLVVVDAEQVRSQATNKYVGDVVLRQLAQADLLLVNKTDLVTGAELAALRAWLDDVAPGTRRIETVRSEAPLDVVLGTAHGRSGFRADDGGRAAHGAAYRSWTVTRKAPLTQSSFAMVAEQLSQKALRAKGFVRLADSPELRHLYQQVGTRWTLKADGAWAAPDAPTRIVAIGLDNGAPPRRRTRGAA